MTQSTTDPIGIFRSWYADAQENERDYPDAMSLATVDEHGHPDVRIVLLKELDERGFVFYTNFQGAKGRQILHHRRAGLCFYWKSLHRQVRVRGPVKVLSDGEADAYFASRPRESQLGAWASNQSTAITGRDELLARLEHFRAKYDGSDVPRPPHWSGFRITPEEIEFWTEGEFRLHDRRLYRRNNDEWSMTILAP